MDDPLIPKHGGYRSLKSFQIAQIVHDLTVRFTKSYIDPKSRTRDQMEQAARSGVQKIAEGSQDSGTSRKSELKLTNIARGSLEELRLDYEDFLRQHGLPLWKRNDPRRQALIDRRPKTEQDVAEWARAVHSGVICGPCGPSTSSTMSTSSTGSTQEPPTYPEILANAAHTLITVACALLDAQIRSLARSFEVQGGFTERMFRHRRAARNDE